MPKALLRTVVIGCGLLVRCELAHADTFELAAADPVCQTPPQPASVTCMASNSGSGAINVNSPIPVRDNLWTISPSDRSDLELAISSSQSILVTGGNGPVRAVPDTVPLISVSFTMINGATYGGLRFSIDSPGAVPPDLEVTVLPAQNVSATMGVLLPELTFTPLSVGPNGQRMFSFQANTGFSIASITIEGSGIGSGLNVLRLIGPLTDIGFTEPVQPPFVPTPEPDTLSLLVFGITGFGLCFRKLRRCGD